MGEPVLPPVLHQGSWQSCDGEERVLEHRTLGVFHFEIHMGPRREFALYDHIVDGEHSHKEEGNMILPIYEVGWERMVWKVPQLGVKLTVAPAGGSREECESFYVKIEKMDRR